MQLFIAILTAMLFLWQAQEYLDILSVPNWKDNSYIGSPRSPPSKLYSVNSLKSNDSELLLIRIIGYNNVINNGDFVAMINYFF